MKLKVIELFAGVGSQTKALGLAGIEHEVVAISEFDKFADASYKAIHGYVNNLGDITKIEKLPEADLWTYSFPCQDISLAGQGKGLAKDSGTRSGLLWEVERLLNVALLNFNMPKFLLMENVKALINKKNMPDFQKWCDYLETLGYKNYWQVMNAKDYGIPQNRERVFMISILDSDKPYVFPEKEKLMFTLRDFLENEVDEKYYLSEQVFKTYTCSKNRGGFVRSKQFKPIEKDTEFTRTLLAAAHKQASSDCMIIEPITPTITTTTSSRPEVTHIIEPHILIKDGTKRGYAEAEVGDGVVTGPSGNKNRRGVVQKQSMPTILTSSSSQGVVVKNKWIGTRLDIPSLFTKAQSQMFTEDGNVKRYIGSDIIDEFNEGQCADISSPNGYNKGNRVFNECPTINTTTTQSSFVVKMSQEPITIRRLTPEESWKLMGWSSADFEKAASVVSNTQLYKQAGNGIVVQCLVAIFRNLKEHLE